VPHALVDRLEAFDIGVRPLGRSRGFVLARSSSNIEAGVDMRCLGDA
jgi:hypothetical protein